MCRYGYYDFYCSCEIMLSTWFNSNLSPSVFKTFIIFHWIIFKLILYWCVFLSYRNNIRCLRVVLKLIMSLDMSLMARNMNAAFAIPLDIITVCRKHMIMGGSSLTMLTTVLTMLQKPLICAIIGIVAISVVNKIFNNYI